MIKMEEIMEKIMADIRAFRDKEFAAHSERKMVITDFLDCLDVCRAAYGDLFESWFEGFFPELDVFSPASTRFHHNYAGGWMVHTGEMWGIYKAIPFHLTLTGYGDVRHFMALAILAHDIFKAMKGHYKTAEDRTISFGGGQDHLVSISEYLRDNPIRFLCVDDNEELLHMVRSHHGRMQWGCIEEPKTPAAKLLHQLDMISAHCLK
jgi:23S rRNA maturation-related 3'-5' exoribonuclease YhaM